MEAGLGVEPAVERVNRGLRRGSARLGMHLGLGMRYGAVPELRHCPILACEKRWAGVAAGVAVELRVI